MQKWISKKVKDKYELKEGAQHNWGHPLHY